MDKDLLKEALSPSVLGLAEGVMRAMGMTRRKMTVEIVAAVMALALRAVANNMLHPYRKDRAGAD